LIFEKAVLAAKVSKEHVFNQKLLGEFDKLLRDEDEKTHNWDNSTRCFMMRMKRHTKQMRTCRRLLQFGLLPQFKSFGVESPCGC